MHERKLQGEKDFFPFRNQVEAMKDNGGSGMGDFHLPQYVPDEQIVFGRSMLFACSIAQHCSTLPNEEEQCFQVSNSRTVLFHWPS